MAFNRKNLFGKLDATLFRSIESATTLCKLRGNSHVELAHWLNQLWYQGDCDFKRIAHFFEIDKDIIEHCLAQALERLPGGASAITDFSYLIELAIEQAWIYASLECAENRIRSGHLLMAMLTTVELRKALFSICSSFGRISLKQLTQHFKEITCESPEENEAAADRITRASLLPGEASGALSCNSKRVGLAQYAFDLTAQAREGKIDAVVGREAEISALIDILLRRRQNNPLLTGEAGVGKTAVVEGLALEIVAGNVPPALASARLLMLDIVALAAGASMKGEFEARLKSVLEEALTSPEPVILFIDEIHTLVGAGGAAGTGDAANLLKPMLARGQLRTIGATTWSEFKRHIEKDPALTRRFQVLQIFEPDEEAALSMLRGLVAPLEKHHQIWIMDDALQAAVRLSHRYISGRQLPDKAISLLDTACARVAAARFMPPVQLQHLKCRTASVVTEQALIEKAVNVGKTQPERLNALKSTVAECQNQEKVLSQRWYEERELVSALVTARETLNRAIEQGNDDAELIKAQRQRLAELENSLNALRSEALLVQAEVNSDVIASVVADWTGIPVGQMLKDEACVVKELPQRLAERVIAQDTALQLISDSIQIARTGLADPDKPGGVFLLVGPSGVGKTETALAIAAQLYGGEQNLITINMSEYQEAHSVSTLKGSPPGYIGYGDGGLLTEAVRRRPYSVVLLDEIEKAHPDVHEIFYQVFDKGGMEDSEGRYIDFKNTIILLTSNAGSEVISSLCHDPDTIPDPVNLTNALQSELLKFFPAAFLGRVSVVPYYPLNDEALKVIAHLHLDRIAKRLGQHQLTMKYSDEIVQQIVNQYTLASQGARGIIRYIEQAILPVISRYVLNHQPRKTEKAITLAKEGEEKITFFIREDD